MELKVVPIKGNVMLSPIKEQLIEANRAFRWNAQQTLADFDNEHSEYYCLVNKEILVGYIGLHKIFDEVSINTVWIKETMRKQKLATMLLQFVLEQLHYRKIQSIFLEVRASNEAAIRLYQKFDFMLITRRKDYYQHPLEDALIFQKILEKGV